jgi:DNA-binding transcriptional LysR family regulator
MLGIEARHLAALEAVARTGSFARAARDLGYTQSAVSLQIAALERAAGTRLLERPAGRRPVAPTAAGERMLRHAKRIVAQLAAAQADLAALAGGIAGTLRVGTFQSVSIAILPVVMRAFMDARPGVEVRLHEAPYDEELIELLERGRLDLTFGLHPLEGPFEGVELLRDRYVLLVPASSPLAREPVAPPLAEIGRLPLVGYGRSSYGVEALLRSRGIEPEIVFRTDESRALQRMVAAGIGCALVPSLSIDALPDGVVMLPSDGRVAMRHLGIAWHRDVTLTDAARAFLEIVRAHCRDVQARLDAAAGGERPVNSPLRPPPPD